MVNGQRGSFPARAVDELRELFGERGAHKGAGVAAIGPAQPSVDSERAAVSPVLRAVFDCLAVEDRPRPGLLDGHSAHAIPPSALIRASMSSRSVSVRASCSAASPLGSPANT